MFSDDDIEQILDEEITVEAVIQGNATRVFYSKQRDEISQGFSDVPIYKTTVTCSASFVKRYAVGVGATVQVMNRQFEVKRIDDDDSGLVVLQLYEKR